MTEMAFRLRGKEGLIKKFGNRTVLEIICVYINVHVINVKLFSS